MPVDTCVDERNHLIDGHWLVLFLLEQLGQTFPAVESLLCGGIEIGAELGEGGDLTVLCQEEFEGPGDLFHCLQLSGGTNAGDRKADVDGGTDTFVEEFGFQEDLAVCNGNDVRRDVSGHVTTLCLDDGQRRQGAATMLVVELGGTFEQTRVEIEDAKSPSAMMDASTLPSALYLLSGVGFTPWRTAEQQGHLTVSDGLLGQIVVDNDRMPAVITEPLAHGTS